MCLSTSCPQSISARDKPNLPPVGSTARFRRRERSCSPPPLKMLPSPRLQQSVFFPFPSKAPCLLTQPCLSCFDLTHSHSPLPVAAADYLSLTLRWQMASATRNCLGFFFFPAWIGGKCSIGYWRFTLSSQLTGLAINSESSQYKPVTNEHWVTLVKY